jgi:flagellar protein FlaJ
MVAIAARGALRSVLLDAAIATVVAALLAGAIALAYPTLRAQTRRRSIDASLPHALSYASTLGSSGFTAQDIFRQLSLQPVYGEVAVEAGRIARDMDLLGRSFVEALSEAAARSPSEKFRDFCQGAVSSLSSGGKLKDYFLAKSAQFVDENRQQHKSFLEGLGIIAESYVTLLVAAPLFAIILLSVMLMFGGNAKSLLQGGIILVVIVIQLAQGLFAAVVSMITPEV